MNRARTVRPHWRLTGRRTRLPAAEALAAWRLAAATPGPGVRRVIRELLAEIGFPVRPGPPTEVDAAGHDAWVSRRQSALFGQIAQLRARRRALEGSRRD